MLRKRRSILLVDDELDIIKSVERWVEAAGFNVYGFVDPIQALELLSELFRPYQLSPVLGCRK